jgi:pimeloyl-ACP methyl ester carboxylesterase
MDPPWWDELPRIEVPTLVLWGAEDHKFAALGRRLADAVGPNAETTSLVGVGHAAHLEAPDATAALLVGWARRTVLDRRP